MELIKLLSEQCCANCVHNGPDKSVTPCNTCTQNIRYTNHFKEHPVITSLKIKIEESEADEG